MIKTNKKESSIISSLSHHKYLVLCIGFLIYLWIPIIGIFPLLFFVQLDTVDSLKKRNRFLVISILFLIVLTLSVFISSFPIFSDTALYMDGYLRLDTNTPFEVASIQNNGSEFILYLLFYFLYYLTNGSVYLCLFLNSLIINLLVVFGIVRNLSPKYYPIILFFIYTSIYFYTQNFLMRQFLSNTFLLLAISHVNKSSIIFYTSVLFSLFSHNSNILLLTVPVLIKNYSLRHSNYLIQLLIISKVNLKERIVKLNKRIFSLITLLILILTSFLVFFIIFYKERSVTILLTPIVSFSSVFYDSSSYKLEVYDGYSQEEGIPMGLSTYLDFSFLLIAISSLVLFKKNHRFITNNDFCLIIFYYYGVIAIVLTIFGGFIWRTAFLMFSYSGVFYVLMIKDNRILTPVNLYFILLIGTIKFSLFTRWLFLMNNNSYLQFFDGKPLNQNLFDYINYFINSGNF